MIESKPYRCVNCGEPSAALYKTYGPTVLKLNKCEKCKGEVDKYIEYDSVFVMIDLVLMSKEAQRHVLYNTDFKAYWKLLVILILLETYGVWRSDSLFNIAVFTLCGIKSNNTINCTLLNKRLNITVPEAWRNVCLAWEHEGRADDNDLFIWEKDFYVHFLATLCGIGIFILTVHTMMKMRAMTKNNVPIERVLKAFSLANVSILFTLPMLVWGNAETSAETRILNYALVFVYSFVVYLSVFSVIYECAASKTLMILVSSYMMKYFTSFHMTPSLREFVT